MTRKQRERIEDGFADQAHQRNCAPNHVSVLTPALDTTPQTGMMQGMSSLSAWTILRPTEDGWIDTNICVAGRNDSEAAHEAAKVVGRGAAFRIRPNDGIFVDGLRFPTEPLDYNQRAVATGRMVHPGYLSHAELLLSIAASEADNGGAF